MGLSARQLHMFSRCVLSLTEPTPSADPHRWLTKAVSAFNTLVPFDSAWWGQVETEGPGGAAKNVMHGSLGLSPEFAVEWNAIADCDDFARASMEKLREPMIFDGRQADLADDPEPLREFVRRHGLHHCLAITLLFPPSGLLFFVCMYREQSQPKFNRTDAILLKEYSAHLLSGWGQCLNRANRGRFQDHWDSGALTNKTGRLVYIGRQLCRVLDERFDDWQGTFLPAPLVKTLATPESSPLMRHRAGLTMQPCGSLASLTLNRQDDNRPSPRTLSAAQLYAQGQSYKEVARALSVTPATVRTYLRQAYQQLGVCNKVALAEALRRLGVAD